MTRITLSFLIALLAAASILPFLGVPDVYQVSEGREGVVVNSILENHEYVLPLRNGELVPSKPPLFHWLSAAFAHYRHSYDNFELRFVSSVAAVLLAGMFSYVIAGTVGARAAWLSSAVLLSTYGYLRMGSDGRVDMLLCLLFSTAVLSWFSVYRSIRESGAGVEAMPESIYREVAILSGLAIVTKGPLGIVLPVIVIGSYLLLEEGWRKLRVLVRWSWLWSAVIALPWYIAASWKGGAALFSRQLVFENLERFAGGDGITLKPPWFYLEEFWAHALPWSFIGAAVVLAVSARKMKAGEGIRAAFRLPDDPTKRAAVRLAIVWTVSLFVFYSLSAGKRSAYLLTILPPYSLLLGIWFDSRWDEWRSKISEASATGSRGKWFHSGLWVSLVLMFCGIFLFLVAATGTGWLPGSEKLRLAVSAAGEVVLAHRFLFAASFTILSLTSLLFWIRGASKGSIRLLSWAIFVALQCALVVLMTAGQAARGLTHGYRELAIQTAAAVPPGERLTFIKRKRDESFDGFFFYMARTVFLFEPAKNSEDESSRPQTPGLYLARRGWIDEQPANWTARIEPVLTGGRRVDTPERKVVLFRLKPEEAPPPEVETPSAPLDRAPVGEPEVELEE